MRAQPAAVPPTGPPSPVGLVVLELARQEGGDHDLEDGPLHRDDRDAAQDGLRSKYISSLASSSPIRDDVRD